MPGAVESAKSVYLSVQMLTEERARVVANVAAEELHTAIVKPKVRL